MTLQTILERFFDLLHARIEKHVFTSEDSVRYTFFAALLNPGGLSPEDVVLEYPHPSIKGAYLDTWIPSLDGVTVAVEFKYDREIPSGRNTPRTQKAGKVFHDLYRLGQVSSDVRRLLVYLCNQEMATYFGNPANELTEFFSLGRDQALLIDSTFLGRRSKTFSTSIGQIPNVEVIGLLNRSLPSGHALRVYDVRPLKV